MTTETNDQQEVVDFFVDGVYDVSKSLKRGKINNPAIATCFDFQIVVSPPSSSVACPSTRIVQVRPISKPSPTIDRLIVVTMRISNAAMVSAVDIARNETHSVDDVGQFSVVYKYLLWARPAKARR